MTRVYGLFARLVTPIDYDALDDQPVDLVFVLLAPDHAGADHLKALARISRLLREQRHQSQSCAAPTPPKAFTRFSPNPPPLPLRLKSYFCHPDENRGPDFEQMESLNVWLPAFAGMTDLSWKI